MLAVNQQSVSVTSLFFGKAKKEGPQSQLHIIRHLLHSLKFQGICMCLRMTWVLRPDELGSPWWILMTHKSHAVSVTNLIAAAYDEGLLKQVCELSRKIGIVILCL